MDKKDTGTKKTLEQQTKLREHTLKKKTREKRHWNKFTGQIQGRKHGTKKDTGNKPGKHLKFPGETACAHGPWAKLLNGISLEPRLSFNVNVKQSHLAVAVTKPAHEIAFYAQFKQSHLAAAVAKPSDRMTIRKSIVFQPPSRGSVTVTS